MPKKPSRKQMLSVAADLGPEDGIDPRELAKRRAAEGGPRPARKTLQLCGQVGQALGQALASSDDEVLQGLDVAGVVPAPDASRLLVTVRAAAGGPLDPARVLGHLARASGWLRSEVAAAITRRRVPQLDYRVEAGPA